MPSTRVRRTMLGRTAAAKHRIAVVASRFNEEITRALADGAVACLRAHGNRLRPSDVLWTPGAFELPLVADALAGSGRYDAIVCLGAVIKGETPHFEYVSAECARGIQQVMLRTGIPVAFGVLTTLNRRQALARSGGKKGDKGWDAAVTAIEMATLLRPLRKARRRR